MVSKWQIDKETSKAKPDETEFEKIERFSILVKIFTSLNSDLKMFFLFQIIIEINF